MNKNVVEKTLQSIDNIDRLTDLAAISIYNTSYEALDKYDIMQEHATPEYVNEEFIQESVLAGVLIGAGIIGVAVSAFFIIKKIIDSGVKGDKSKKDSKGGTSAAGIDLTNPEEAKKFLAAKMEAIKKWTEGSKVNIDEMYDVEAAKKINENINAFSEAMTKVVDAKDADEIQKAASALDSLDPTLPSLIKKEEHEITKDTNVLELVNLECVTTLAEAYKNLEKRIADVEKQMKSKVKKDGAAEETEAVDAELQKKVKEKCNAFTKNIEKVVKDERAWLEKLEAAINNVQQAPAPAKEAPATAETETAAAENKGTEDTTAQTGNGDNSPKASTKENLGEQMEKTKNASEVPENLKDVTAPELGDMGEQPAKKESPVPENNDENKVNITDSGLTEEELTELSNRYVQAAMSNGLSAGMGINVAKTDMSNILRSIKNGRGKEYIKSIETRLINDIKTEPSNYNDDVAKAKAYNDILPEIYRLGGITNNADKVTVDLQAIYDAYKNAPLTTDNLSDEEKDKLVDLAKDKGYTSTDVLALAHQANKNLSKTELMKFKTEQLKKVNQGAITSVDQFNDKIKAEYQKYVDVLTTLNPQAQPTILHVTLNDLAINEQTFNDAVNGKIEEAPQPTPEPTPEETPEMPAISDINEKADHQLLDDLNKIKQENTEKNNGTVTPEQLEECVTALRDVFKRQGIDSSDMRMGFYRNMFKSIRDSLESKDYTKCTEIIKQHESALTQDMADPADKKEITNKLLDVNTVINSLYDAYNVPKENRYLMNVARIYNIPVGDEVVDSNPGSPIHMVDNSKVERVKNLISAGVSDEEIKNILAQENIPADNIDAIMKKAKGVDAGARPLEAALNMNGRQGQTDQTDTSADNTSNAEVMAKAKPIMARYDKYLKKIDALKLVRYLPKEFISNTGMYSSEHIVKDISRIYKKAKENNGNGIPQVSYYISNIYNTLQRNYNDAKRVTKNTYNMHRVLKTLCENIHSLMNVIIPMFDGLKGMQMPELPPSIYTEYQLCEARLQKLQMIMEVTIPEIESLNLDEELEKSE